jgi:hypothetical protein
MINKMTIDEDPKVEAVQVILITFFRGDGKSFGSTLRHVTQVRAMDGTLIAENDPCPDAVPNPDKASAPKE